MRVALGTAEVIKADALNLPLADESVDLIITSPPYFALRSYRDGGEHYDGQVGSEDTPGQFIDTLIAATREMVRVLKPSGSIWVNLGDKYAGSGGHNNANVSRWHTAPIEGNKNEAARAKLARMDENEAEANIWKATRRNAPDAYNKASDGIRAKSLMGLPWRYAIRCIDELGLILRAEIVWDKPNGLPESVGDRVRRSHEQWFHFVKSPSYFAAIDEVREAHADPRTGHNVPAKITSKRDDHPGTKSRWNPEENEYNPLGKLPGSVWRIPSEPLKVPEELGVDHFAAFPTEWPRRIILGWSPGGICTVCGEGRRPVVEKELIVRDERNWGAKFAGSKGSHLHNRMGSDEPAGSTSATITGYACSCPDATAPTIPATVLDPFGGTGTVAMVARALGRKGISVDLSADYCRLAEWRCNDEASLVKAREKTYGPEPLKVNARSKAPNANERRFLAKTSRRIAT